LNAPLSLPAPRILCKQKAKVNTPSAFEHLGYKAHFGWKALPHESARSRRIPRNCRRTFSGSAVAAFLQPFSGPVSRTFSRFSPAFAAAA